MSFVRKLSIFVKELPIRVMRTVFYPPLYAFWGALVGLSVGMIFAFWIWLFSLFFDFDASDPAGVVIAACACLGVVAAFFAGIWNGMFEEVE